MGIITVILLASLTALQNQMDIVGLITGAATQSEEQTEQLATKIEAESEIESPLKSSEQDVGAIKKEATSKTEKKKNKKPTGKK